MSVCNSRQNNSVSETYDNTSNKKLSNLIKNIRYIVQCSVELLGNEYIRYKKHIGENIERCDRLAEKLATEGLIYTYRQLFLYYSEELDDSLKSLFKRDNLFFDLL